VLRLWVLRLLVCFGGHRELIGDRHVSAEEVMEFLGLSQCLTAEPFSPEAARAALRAKLATLEGQNPALPAGSALARNIAWLGELLNLSAVEQDILHFTVLQAQHPVLERTLDQLGGLTFGSIHQLFAQILGHSQKAVRQALRSSGTLARTGLLTCDLRNRYMFTSKVEMLGGLAERLCMRKANSTELFRQYFVPAPASTLGASDYPHLAKDLAILECYLRDTLAARRKGVNVLIHGVPGTGKTQFVRVLAQQLGCRLFEVATEDEDGDPLQGKYRFRSYRLAQHLLAGTAGNLVLFDEVEDVFSRHGEDEGPERNRGTLIKGWINKTLEENPVPAVWVTNAVEAIDGAFIRRFDYVLEIGVPPRSVRAKVLDGYLGQLPVKPDWKAAMAGHERLVPAVVERAAKVVRSVCKADPGLDASQALARVIGNTLEAMGAPRAARGALPMLVDYRPDLLCTDCDLAVVKEGLLAQGQGRLCFFGPPGTGKTAFGRHLAEALDRPLLVKRASDLQSKWVGETEQNLARMFEEAMNERAVLLLDEADSFLQDRKGAQRSWEISQVNELLTQMESFEGIFIASTNLMDSLDGAALRRFDLKIHFDYLKADQSWSMFQDTARRLGLEPGPGARAGLAHLTLLTPGDFANVVRQARLRRIASAADLVARLAAECAAKPEGRRNRIGFQGRP
jgi:SpoVK/Ycf46/Vps4 family AAA+-type ATPase